MKKPEDDRERIAQLEWNVDALWQMIDVLADAVNLGHARGLALQDILQRAGVLAEGVEAKIAAYKLSPENQIEFGPEYRSFREARRRLRGRAPGSQTPDET